MMQPISIPDHLFAYELEADIHLRINHSLKGQNLPFSQKLQD